MFNVFTEQYDADRYFIVTYNLASKTTLRDAAWALAIGQSVGNPNVRNAWETDELFEKHSCIILGDEEELRSRKEGEIKIGFPLANTDFAQDGISHILCQVMGGQMDIVIVTRCHALKIDFPEHVEKQHFLGPKFGIQGIRDFTGAHDKPLFGGIVNTDPVKSHV